MPETRDLDDKIHVVKKINRLNILTTLGCTGYSSLYNAAPPHFQRYQSGMAVDQIYSLDSRTLLGTQLDLAFLRDSNDQWYKFCKQRH